MQWFTFIVKLAGFITSTTYCRVFLQGYFYTSYAEEAETSTLNVGESILLLVLLH